MLIGKIFLFCFISLLQITENLGINMKKDVYQTILDLALYSLISISSSNMFYWSGSNLLSRNHSHFIQKASIFIGSNAFGQLNFPQINGQVWSIPSLLQDKWCRLKVWSWFQVLNWHLAGIWLQLSIWSPRRCQCKWRSPSLGWKKQNKSIRDQKAHNIKRPGRPQKTTEDN